METVADHIIDALGGTTKVATLTSAPVSTVHSWRKIGIPPSRLAHLKLAAAASPEPKIAAVNIEEVAEQARKAGAPETASHAKPSSNANTPEEAKHRAAAA